MVKKLMIMLGLTGGITLLAVLPWLTTGPGTGIGAALLQTPESPPVSAAHRGLPNSPFAHMMQTAVTCTVNITTTDSPPTGNHSFDTAAALAPYYNQSLLVQNTMYPFPDQVSTQPDFYRLDNAYINYRYTVNATADGTTNYNLGIIVYDRDRRAVITDTNTQDFRASVTFEAFNEGPYYIEVFQVSEQCTGGTYTLSFSSSAPTPTASPTVTPTPQPTSPAPTGAPPTGFDQYEPNFDFNTATTIAPGVTYSLNFIPWGSWQVDNDFFKIWVKPGLRFTCETSDLDPGVDPNMIFYGAPDFNRAVGSNDDVALGDYNSRVSYYSTYEGYLYILVGQGTRMAPRDTANSKYKLRCEMAAPGAATTTPAPGAATTTPAPDKDGGGTPGPTSTPRPPSSPIATPTPPPPVNTDLTYRLITTPPPAVPTPTPTGFRTFRVRVYYDENQDGQAGAGEGIPGFFVRVLSPESGAELARGYTDDQGQLSFTVPTVGTVRLVVPLLGFDRLIEAAKPEVTIRIAPPPLPNTIP